MVHYSAILRQTEHIRAVVGKALKSPVQTRWLSYYNMVLALKENCHLLDEFEEAYSSVAKLLDISRLGYFKEYLGILKPIADIVLQLQVNDLPLEFFWLYFYFS